MNPANVLALTRGSCNQVSFQPQVYDAFPIFFRIVHNYVIWRLIMDLMPHMPPQYDKTRAKFRKVLLGVMTDR